MVHASSILACPTSPAQGIQLDTRLLVPPLSFVRGFRTMRLGESRICVLACRGCMPIRAGLMGIWVLLLVCGAESIRLRVPMLFGRWGRFLGRRIRMRIGAGAWGECIGHAVGCCARIEGCGRCRLLGGWGQRHAMDCSARYEKYGTADRWCRRAMSHFDRLCALYQLQGRYRPY